MRPQHNNNNNKNRNRNRNRRHTSSGGGGNQGGGSGANRVYDSNGPDVKLRGTAQTIAEKYMQLGRDAQSSGDTVMAESYYQFGDHYYRLWLANQPAGQPLQFSRRMAEEEFEDEGNDQSSEGDGPDNEGQDSAEGGEGASSEGDAQDAQGESQQQNYQPRNNNNRDYNNNNNNNNRDNNREGGNRFKQRWPRRNDRYNQDGQPNGNQAAEGQGQPAPEGQERFERNDRQDRNNDRSERNERNEPRQERRSLKSGLLHLLPKWLTAPTGKPHHS